MSQLEVLDRAPAATTGRAGRVADLNAEYGAASAQELLRLVLEEGIVGRTALVSSFGADSAVLLHMTSQIDPATLVLFLDTGKHFAETLSYRDRLVRELGLSDVRSITPDAGRIATADRNGNLFANDPDLCCHIRKTEPLARALAGFDAWITGRKRTQSATRAALTRFESDGLHIKINPLAAWTSAQIAAYMHEHNVPAHPLVAEGYPSIGCAPCTSRVGSGEDARVGRWRGRDKTECGIHIVNGKVIRSAAASDDRDPDGPIWKDGAFRRNAWAKAADNEPLSEQPVFLSKTRWLAERGNLDNRTAPLGLLLAAGESIDDVAAELPRFALIALDFPKFSDGRAFSTARLLREKYAFAGELRAVGNVLADQVPFMRRVGFDSFEVANVPTRRALAEGRIPEVKLHYQPAGTPEPPAGTRPWLRRTPD